MGNARNSINVLSSDIVIACGMGAGTASEITLALKSNKKVILLNDEEESKIFFKNLSPLNVYIVDSLVEALKTAREVLMLATNVDNLEHKQGTEPLREYKRETC
jgi:predicted Rossmann-fold nucleotide-binding protein